MTLTAPRPRRSLVPLDGMKVAVLAADDTRLTNTGSRPKPMVEIGGRPLLWHLMKHFARYGARDFVVALGYRGDQVKRYMLDYSALRDNLSVHLKDGRVERDGLSDDWNVDLIDTGIKTGSAGRIKQLQGQLGGTFILATGDGVSDLDIEALLAFHRSKGRLATMTAVRPPARFGKLAIVDNQVIEFAEKPQLEEGWINGSVFVLEPGIFDYIDGDSDCWEQETLDRLARDGELAAYRHESFWQAVDTLRDKQQLEELWQSGDPPWKTWK